MLQPPQTDRQPGQPGQARWKEGQGYFDSALSPVFVIDNVANVQVELRHACIRFA